MSCSSSDDGGSSDEFIIADVETLNFESSNVPNGVTAVKIDGGDSITYVVQGFDTAGNAIVLAIGDFDGTGTYNASFGEDNNSASALFSDQSAAWSSAGGTGGSGAITVVVDNDDETSGTFQFIGVQADNNASTKSVTNGSFRVKY